MDPTTDLVNEDTLLLVPFFFQVQSVVDHKYYICVTGKWLLPGTDGCSSLLGTRNFKHKSTLPNYT